MLGCRRFTAGGVAAGTAFDKASETRWGGAVGTGIEIGFAPGWSVAFEYDHLFMGRDSLNFANQHGISGSYNAATGILTLSGPATLANYQAALDSITYSSSLADPSKGGTDAARTVTFSTNDGLNGSKSLAASLSIPGMRLSGPTK